MTPDAMSQLLLGHASSDEVRALSGGEVTSPDTIDWRDFTPIPGGLFCPLIFGEVRGWLCDCGLLDRRSYVGTVCERCGVELSRSRLLSERIGHVDLAVPVGQIACLPVISPAFRPIIKLDDKKCLISDLNDLYRRVVNRNNRLKKLQEVNAPPQVLDSERDKLREAVECLIDNERATAPMLRENGKRLRSLTDLLASLPD